MGMSDGPSATITVSRIGTITLEQITLATAMQRKLPFLEPPLVVLTREGVPPKSRSLQQLCFVAHQPLELQQSDNIPPEAVAYSVGVPRITLRTVMGVNLVEDHYFPVVFYGPKQ